MIQITTEQARQRLKTLPEELRDFIFSAEISEMVEHIGEKNHLDDEKQKGLAKVISYVLLGFIHQEDSRKEIQERLGVNPMIANELQNILIRDVFSRVSAFLEGSYSPVAKNIIIGGQALDSIVPMKPISLENMPKPAPLPSVPPASFPSVQPAQIPAAPAATPSPIPTKVSPLAFTKTPSLTPTPSETPKPMVFVTQTGGQSAPVGNVPKFKMEPIGTLTGSAFGGSSAPTFSSAPRPAKIELGFSPTEKKATPTPSFTFETQKSTVRYGAPVAPTFSSTSPSPTPIIPPSAAIGEPAAPKKVEIPNSFKVSVSPISQKNEPSLPKEIMPAPFNVSQNTPTPPPAPKFEPPKPLL